MTFETNILKKGRLEIGLLIGNIYVSARNKSGRVNLYFHSTVNVYSKQMKSPQETAVLRDGNAMVCSRFI